MSASLRRVRLPKPCCSALQPVTTPGHRPNTWPPSSDALPRLIRPSSSCNANATTATRMCNAWCPPSIMDNLLS